MKRIPDGSPLLKRRMTNFPSTGIRVVMLFRHRRQLLSRYFSSSFPNPKQAHNRRHLPSLQHRHFMLCILCITSYFNFVDFKAGASIQNRPLRSPPERRSFPSRRHQRAYQMQICLGLENCQVCHADSVSSLMPVMHELASQIFRGLVPNAYPAWREMHSPRNTNWTSVAGHAVQSFLKSKDSITSSNLPDPVQTRSSLLFSFFIKFKSFSSLCCTKVLFPDKTPDTFAFHIAVLSTTPHGLTPRWSRGLRKSRKVSKEKSVTVTHCVAGQASQTAFVMHKKLSSLVLIVFCLMISALQIFSDMQGKFVMLNSLQKKLILFSLDKNA